MKYLMFPHGGSGNHGCEAIVRTTTELLKDKDCVLFSDCVEEDKKYIEDAKFRIVSPRQNVRRFSLSYINAAINYHARGNKESYDLLTFRPIISICDCGDVLLSIGGDNYCYGDNAYIYMVNKYARRKGCKTVLWGCSVEEEDITTSMRADLEAYDLIVARESISYEVLRRINHNTIICPDPAFSLPVENAFWPTGLRRRPFIGINVSPLILNREKVSGITTENYKFLIEQIIKETEYDVALIPHVVKHGNDDREVLDMLYSLFGGSGRIFLIEDQNCMCLKDIISRCECFIGARTHATIAAYSMCVPTLVVGYSVKAKGIATDLFGTDENYVLPVQGLTEKDDLYKAFKWLVQNRQEIRAHLNRFIPNYIREIATLSEIIERKFE